MTAKQLRWHWEGDRRVCDDCAREVHVFKEGAVCSYCGKAEEAKAE